MLGASAEVQRFQRRLAGGRRRASISRRGPLTACASPRRQPSCRPILDRANFQLLTGVRATRLLLESGRVAGRRVCRRRRRADDPGGARGDLVLRRLRDAEADDALRARARRTNWREHGIAVVRDLPGVGANLQDHLLLGVGFEATLIRWTSPEMLAEAGLFTWTDAADRRRLARPCNTSSARSSSSPESIGPTAPASPSHRSWRSRRAVGTVDAGLGRPGGHRRGRSAVSEPRRGSGGSRIRHPIRPRAGTHQAVRRPARPRARAWRERYQQRRACATTFARSRRRCGTRSAPARWGPERSGGGGR